MSFDITTSEARARLLARLRAERPSFTESEQVAYNTLRDALMRMARGAEADFDIDALLEPLAHFLEEVPVVETKASAPKTQEKEEATVSNPRMSSFTLQRVRRGPDISASPVAESHVASVPGEEITAPTSVPVVAEEPVAPNIEPVPDPLPEVIVPDLPIVEDPSPEMPIPEAPKPVSPLTVSPTERIETINDELNAFAHGTAFKWLSDPSTGYRTYLNELLLLRSAIAESQMGTQKPEDQTILSVRIDGLQKMADAVRRAVGGGERAVSTAETQSSAVSAIPDSVSVSAVVHETLSGTASEVPTKEVPLSQTTEEVAENVRVQAVTDAYNHEVPDDMPEDMRETRWSDTSSLQSAVADAGIEDEQSEPASEIAGPIADTDASLSEEVLPVDAMQDPLLSPEIEKGLNDLLAHWLGSTGFLGFGSSGVKHPSWIAMRDLYVDGVLANDGVIPPALNLDIYANLAENIRAWKRSYGLMDNEGEVVDHFVRRVVEASTLKPA